MKQLKYYLKSIALVTALGAFAISCDKTEEAPNLTQSQEITLTASTIPRTAENNRDTKVTYDPNGNVGGKGEMSVLWAAGDAFKMYASDGSAGATFTLVGTGGSATGQFSTTNAVSDGGYDILFPAPGATETGSWGDLTLSYLGQEYDGNVAMSATGTNLSQYNYMVSTATIANNTSTSNIAFSHLGCVLQFTITMPSGYTVNANGAPVELIITAPGMSSDIKPSAPSAAGTSVSTQVLKLKNVTPDGNGKFTAYLMSAPFTIPQYGSLTITVGCQKPNDGPTHSYVFTKEFEKQAKVYDAGKRYKFDLSGAEAVSAGEDYVEIGGVRWATGNIVKVTNKNELSFAAIANQQGLVFKWGSLLGLNMATELTFSSQGDDFNSAIVFWPTEYPNKNTINAWDTDVTNNKEGIPYEDEKTAGSNCGIDKDAFLRLHSPAGYDAATGKGDICRYMSAQGWLKGKWRMPTSKELQDMYDASAQIGGSKGNKQGDFVAITSTNDLNGQYVIPSGWFFGTGAGSGTTSNMDIPLPNSIFLPTGGYRIGYGQLTNMGSQGRYWSCSPLYNTGFGGNLTLRSSSIAPDVNNPRSFGCSVRCVLE